MRELTDAEVLQRIEDCDVICADTLAGWCGPLNCAMAWAETGDLRFIDDPIPDYPPEPGGEAATND